MSDEASRPKPPIQSTWPHLQNRRSLAAGTNLPGHRHPWLLPAVVAAVAAGAVVTVVDLAPWWTSQPLSHALTAGTALALVAALGAVVLRFSGRSRPVWILLLFAQLLSTLAVVIVQVLLVIGVDHVPSWAFTAHLLAHPLQILALLVLVRRRAQGDRAAWLDAALLTLTVYALVRGFLLDLPGNSPRAGPLAVFFGPFPIVAGIAVVAVMLRVVLVTGRDGALLLLLAASVAAAAAGIVNNIAARTVPHQHSGWTDAFWLAGYTLTVAAALHPRAARIGNEQPPDHGGLGTLRIASLAVGALLIPTLLFGAITLHESTKTTIWAWMSVAAMAIVLVRLWLVVQALQTQTRFLQVQARTDELTGLANRRTWEFQLARVAQPTVEGPPPTRVIAIADLDYFKGYNDSHGHRSGDDMLRRCAAAWKEAMEPGTFLARYGGEEFGLLLTSESTSQAHQLLDSLRRATPAPMTVSVGATEWPDGEPAESAVERADLALYAAKNLGRDRVEWLPTAAEPLSIRDE